MLLSLLRCGSLIRARSPRHNHNQTKKQRAAARAGGVIGSESEADRSGTTALVVADGVIATARPLTSAVTEPCHSESEDAGSESDADAGGGRVPRPWSGFDLTQGGRRRGGRDASLHRPTAPSVLLRLHGKNWSGRLVWGGGAE
jgi:hypothetical protein